MKRTLTKEQWEKLRDAVDATNARIWAYSAKGMRGKLCLGIIPNADTPRYFMYLAQILIENEDEEILDLLQDEPSKEDPHSCVIPTTRSGGKGIIVYFPNLLVDDYEEEE